MQASSVAHWIAAGTSSIAQVTSPRPGLCSSPTPPPARSFNQIVLKGLRWCFSRLNLLGDLCGPQVKTLSPYICCIRPSESCFHLRLLSSWLCTARPSEFQIHLAGSRCSKRTRSSLALPTAPSVSSCPQKWLSPLPSSIYLPKVRIGGAIASLPLRSTQSLTPRSPAVLRECQLHPTPSQRGVHPARHCSQFPGWSWQYWP